MAAVISPRNVSLNVTTPGPAPIDGQGVRTAAWVRGGSRQRVSMAGAGFQLVTPGLPAAGGLASAGRAVLVDLWRNGGDWRMEAFAKIHIRFERGSRR